MSEQTFKGVERIVNRYRVYFYVRGYGNAYAGSFEKAEDAAREADSLRIHLMNSEVIPMPVEKKKLEALLNFPAEFDSHLAKTPSAKVTEIVEAALYAKEHDKKYRGVFRYGSKFRVFITIRGKNKNAGNYDTAEEAARVYDLLSAAMMRCGLKKEGLKNSKLNFPYDPLIAIDPKDPKWATVMFYLEDIKAGAVPRFKSFSHFMIDMLQLEKIAKEGPCVDPVYQSRIVFFIEGLIKKFAAN